MWFLFVYIAIVSLVNSQELYNFSSIEKSGAGVCSSTEKLREKIHKDVELFVTSGTVQLTRPCGCGGPGWRRAAYLNMSDPTQTCPPAWELINTPRRSCARPSSAGDRSCYSAMSHPNSRHSVFAGLWKNHWISGWTPTSISSGKF